LGLYIEDLPRSPEKFELLGLHKLFGITVLSIALLRILWRAKEGAITSLSVAPAWQEKIAQGVHHLLLLATLLMPVSGIMMNVGGGRALVLFGTELITVADKVEWMGTIGGSLHDSAVGFIIAALALHILGALKHQFIDKDGTVSRMLGFNLS
jgi:cytochrome b561